MAASRWCSSWPAAHACGSRRCVGIQLDEDRRPVFVLAADRADIGSHDYETLDLHLDQHLMDAAGSGGTDRR